MACLEAVSIQSRSFLLLFSSFLRYFQIVDNLLAVTELIRIGERMEGLVCIPFILRFCFLLSVY